MRNTPNMRVERFRTDGVGNNGMFDLQQGLRQVLTCVVSDGFGWDHVSVSVTLEGRQPHRVPSWEEMCYVKGLFFRDDEAAVQYHPAKSGYVDDHQFVLHLWRPQKEPLPAPLPTMVGMGRKK